jgi:hypothetical protein
MEDLEETRIHTLLFQLRASISPRRLAQHLGGVHKDALPWMQHHRRRKEIWHRLLASGTLSLHYNRLHTLHAQRAAKIPMLGSAKSARRVSRRLLALLAPRRLVYLEKLHVLLSPTPRP